MLIIKTDTLKKETLKLLKELVSYSNKIDNTNYSAPDDADFYALLLSKDDARALIGTEPTGAELTGAELTGTELTGTELISCIALYKVGETYKENPVKYLEAFTKPDYRKKGYFKLLLDSLKDELSGNVLMFGIYENTSAIATLKSLGAFHDHDELLMELKLKELESIKNFKKLKDDNTPKIRVNIDEIKEKESLRNECRFHVTTFAGECYLRAEGESAYIYGVLTYEKFKKKGYAFLMLKNLLNYLKEKGMERVTLEVFSKNIPAIKLYKKLGFKVKEKIDYYYLK